MNRLGIGKVTPKGIFFKSLYYSCSEAVAKRWYEAAMDCGGWNVIIIYCNRDISQVLCYDAMNGKWFLCKLIKYRTEPDEKLNKYFSSIQKLMETRRQKKRKAD